MPIYTKTGDDGTTSLYGGKRIIKSDNQIEAYGSVDELSSFLGLLLTKITDKNDKYFLTRIQKDLYRIMAILSGAKMDTLPLKHQVTLIEQKINKITLQLPKLNSFILPQGTETSTLFHIARTVCRKAERAVVRYSNNREIIQYLNRLSDFLFTFARYYNRGREILV